MNYYDELKILVNKINFNNFNYKIIEDNINELFIIYEKIKIIWNSMILN
jgi:hypothetical protein